MSKYQAKGNRGKNLDRALTKVLLDISKTSRNIAKSLSILSKQGKGVKQYVKR